MITETLILKIRNKTVEVEHEGVKKFEDQRGGIKEVELFLEEMIFDKGNFEGFVPYNNFESSFNWKIIEKNNKMNE